jgi:hypothetical protein
MGEARKLAENFALDVVGIEPIIGIREWVADVVHGVGEKWIQFRIVENLVARISGQGRTRLNDGVLEIIQTLSVLTVQTAVPLGRSMSFVRVTQQDRRVFYWSKWSHFSPMIA